MLRLTGEDLNSLGWAVPSEVLDAALRTSAHLPPSISMPQIELNYLQPVSQAPIANASAEAEEHSIPCQEAASTQAEEIHTSPLPEHQPTICSVSQEGMLGGEQQNTVHMLLSQNTPPEPVLYDNSSNVLQPSAAPLAAQAGHIDVQPGADISGPRAASQTTPATVSPPSAPEAAPQVVFTMRISSKVVIHYTSARS